MTTDVHATAGDALAASTADASLARTAGRSAEIAAAIAVDPSRFRVLTGDRPTGNLHLGHYFGTLANRVALQRKGVETFVVIADYQVIADRDGVGPIGARVRSLVTDYLAVGLDPDRTTIFTHSAVPALHQLMLPFLSLVTDAELRRNPTVKAEHDATGGRPMSGLLLTYPVHQAADILFCKANVVPVGKDQLPHLEQARVIARRFDQRYGRVDPEQPVFPTPDALLSPAVNLLGIDGHKMSKSRGNAIELAMDADTTARHLRATVTDGDRTITYDPARRPEVSNLVLLGALASGRDPYDVAADIGSGGARALKCFVIDAVNEHLAPIRARRAEIDAAPDLVRHVIAAGNARANAIAAATLDETRAAMHLRYDGDDSPRRVLLGPHRVPHEHHDGGDRDG
jgi:tryptophanyl-tRNA synthetase